ncbi:glutathione S-transferase family protein [Albimonas sp. CAU 1670]|uniref:glutathione S-transferase family protein n=1 Tax=Albimonas sp. CAU 1670 TaxID=3032599 RepID=UPI0023DAC9E7|nr:glutathione S-transferase family protein [Albimonas sp. CAU 1670]MDF2233097.1 glutathione S-transferase family protein [Albimonas sp. CAU 1670]
MILHLHPFSQNSRRVEALLNCAGVVCERRVVDLMKGDHRRPEFLALNPNGQIPVLEDDGLVLAESMAILRHICRSRGLEDWHPGDPARHAQVDQWLDWIQCRIARPTSLVFFNTIVADPIENAALIAEGRRLLADLVPILEAALSGREWLVGEGPTIADLALVTGFQNLAFIDARPSAPALDAWFDRVNALPGVRAALPEPFAQRMGLAAAA